MPVLTKMAAPEPCHLLDLPRELRDMIYEYALTEEGGLVVSMLGSRRVCTASDEDGPDPNQLKFACRQLRAETKGLGLRYNDITFSGSVSFGLFHEFTSKHCSRAHFARVKRVVIMQQSGNRLISRLQTAHSIGKAYPSLSVEVRCSWLHEYQGILLWCSSGSRIQYAIRGTFPDLAQPPYAGVGVHSGFAFKSGFGADSKNVRVFPGSFNEARLRKAAPSRWPDIDGWVAQYKKWFQERF